MTPYKQQEARYVANRGLGMFLILGGAGVALQKLTGVHFRGEHHNEVWWMVPFLLLFGLYMVRRHGRLLTEVPDNAADWLIFLGSLASIMGFAAQSAILTH